MDTGQKKAYKGDNVNAYCWVPHKIIVSKRTRYSVTISPPECDYGVFILLMNEMLAVLSDKQDRWIFVVEQTESGRYHMHGLYFNNAISGTANAEKMKDMFKDVCFVDIRKCYDTNGWLKYMFKDVKNDVPPLYVTYLFKDKGLKYVNKFPSIFSRQCKINSFGDIQYELNGMICIDRVTSIIDTVMVTKGLYEHSLEGFRQAHKMDSQNVVSMDSL